MNINASKEHKKDTSRIIRSNNKLLDSSREANRNKYADTIQCRVPYSEFEEPHPIAETGSYSPHADDSIFRKNRNRRSQFKFGSKTRDEVLGKPEYHPRYIGTRVVSIIDSSGQYNNVEGIQLDHAQSWENIANIMDSHNIMVADGLLATYYTVYDAKKYYNDQSNLHPVLGSLNASAGAVGVALYRYPNPNLAHYIGDLQTSWMNFQNYISSGIVESQGRGEHFIINKLVRIKETLDMIVDENIV